VSAGTLSIQRLEEVAKPENGQISRGEAERTGPSGAKTTVYRVDSELASALANQCVYVEQGRSSKVGAKARPLFEQMKRDAAARKFSRLLAWKVSRLGRNMREVINTVYELADNGVTVYPVKSPTGPINSAMGKLLWGIQAWYAEMENEERSDAVHSGQACARAAGKHVGRPKAIFDCAAVHRLRREGRSWAEIAKSAGTSVGSVRRAFQIAASDSMPCQNCPKSQ
jgi:DNA invertase Pin-like site-specific DNA recombinase